MILSDPVTADLAAAVHHQSWDWFLELHYRLDLAAELVDDKGVPVLPAVESHVATALRRLLTDPGHAVVQAAVAQALQSRAPQLVNVEHLDVGCFPLVIAGIPRGALVLARERTGRSSVELQSLGSWLSSVILAHLTSVRGDEDDMFDRVASLHGLLNHAVTSGSSRDVVSAFAEALAVWDDIEVRGYVEDMRGRFVLEVALAGSDSAVAPAAIDDDLLRGDIGLVRLSKSDAERLGFAVEDDLFAAGFGKQGGEYWLLALSGRIAQRDESRLALSIKMLREAVRHADRIAAARVDWSILQHLLVASDNVETPAKQALAELAASVNADVAALVVTTFNGMHVLSLGAAAAFSGRGRDEEGHELLTTADIQGRYRLAIAVQRVEGRPFMRRDQQVLEGAAPLFVSWLSGVLQRPGAVKDRRTPRRQHFGDIVERVAVETVRQGVSVSVVVMAARDARFRPDLLRQCVSDIRAQLRESDLVGTLTESEIGVLLTEATAAGADAVVRRLRVGVDDAQAGGLTPFTVGVASRSVEWPAGESLVGAARDAAWGRERA